MAELGYEFAKATIIPDEIYEVIPVGKGFGLAVKGTKKVVAIYKDYKTAKNAIEVSTKIKLENGFYSVNGMKISQKYYEKLWDQKRPAPFIQAREILNSNPKIMPDPRKDPGYFRYEANGLEMIYNPKTGQIGHIQPIKRAK